MVKGWKTEDRRQKTEDRRGKEDGRQKREEGRGKRENKHQHRRVPPLGRHYGRMKGKR